jgi:hypothetical protein
LARFRLGARSTRRGRNGDQPSTSVLGTRKKKTPSPGGTPLPLSVGSGVSQAILRMVFVSLASIFGGAIACILIALLVITKRDRNRKILQSGSLIPNP